MSNINHPYVFVYGTLKYGHGNNRLLRNEVLVGQGVTHNKFLLKDNGYPYACPPTDEDYPPPLPIIGEIWTCDANTLDRLDGLEGYEGPGNTYNHYDRVPTVIKMMEEFLLCYMYLYRGQTYGLPLCPTYKNHYYWGKLHD